MEVPSVTPHARGSEARIPMPLSEREGPVERRGEKADPGGPGNTRRTQLDALQRALGDVLEDRKSQVRWVILKQEVWRLLVSLRMSEGKGITPAERFRGLIPALAYRMATNGESAEAVFFAQARLRDALEAVHDWPLV